MTADAAAPTPGTAFVFPAFHNDFSDHPGLRIPGFKEVFAGLLAQAARHSEPRLRAFTFYGEIFSGDELLTQYITYTYSCAASSILRNAGLAPELNAGYSMGIYAALCDSGAIAFETGLDLIRIAFDSMKSIAAGEAFTMGTVIGLDRTTVLGLIAAQGPSTVISNCNAAHSFVISGTRAGVTALLQAAKQEGALNTRILETSLPYHAPWLRKAAEDFAVRIPGSLFSMPHTPLISLVDGTVMRNPESIREEVIRNLDHPLDWYDTFRSMVRHGIGLFVECGLATGLARNARFVEGDFRFLSLEKAFQAKR